MPQLPQPRHDDQSKAFTAFCRRFTRDAKLKGWNESEIREAMAYAEHLRAQGLPIIFDQRHFCLLTGVSSEYVYIASNDPKSCYRHFSIKKRSGGTRRISEPLPSLKRAQRWILDEVLQKVDISRYAKAYKSDTAIRDNARFHRDQDLVVRIDVADFFPSIRLSRVVPIFRSLGYTTAVSLLLSKLCTLNDRLPQGAPTSPAISNLVCRDLDRRLGSFAVERRWRYTRYADDLVFSGQLDINRLFAFVTTALRDYGFLIRKSKTRVMRRHQQQIVTGVVVNEKLQVPREYRRDVRKQIYYINKYGLASHMERCGINQANYVRHLLGRTEHIIRVNPSAPESIRLADLRLGLL